MLVIVIVIVMQGMESEIDSELSSLFSYDRDIKNLHLISPLEYAAMLKQVGAGVRTPASSDIYINLKYTSYKGYILTCSTPATRDIY